LGSFYCSVPGCGKAIDGYVSYSGVVVDKGIEHHILDVRGNERYIILRDEKGITSK
jgi:hypothetical protein